MRKYILTFEDFLESRRFFDNSKIKIIRNKKLGDELLNIKSKIFNDDVNLVSKFTSKKYYNNKKVLFDIKWNNTPNHSIKDRIESRTSFKSVSEFNYYIKDVINEIIPKELDNIKNLKKYAIYDNTINLYIIFKIDYSYNEFLISTILNNIDYHSITDIFYIN